MPNSKAPSMVPAQTSPRHRSPASGSIGGGRLRRANAYWNSRHFYLHEARACGRTLTRFFPTSALRWRAPAEYARPRLADGQTLSSVGRKSLGLI